MVLKQLNNAVDKAIHLNDVAVFDVTYQSYYHSLCFYASKFVGDEAEDVIENLFIKLWYKKQVFNDPGHLRAFLYQATRNACLDFIKTNRKHEKAGSEISENLAIPEDDHLHYLIKAETRAEIYRAVNELPSQCRKVIKLSFLEGLSNSEIATELGISEQTVKNNKVRGLSILKGKLSDNALIVLILMI
jgi:RNA polymerase sigma-70 factor (family 1)